MVRTWSKALLARKLCALRTAWEEACASTENVSVAQTTKDCNMADLPARNYSVMMIAMKVGVRTSVKFCLSEKI